MFGKGISDSGFRRLAQALSLYEDQERIQNPEIEIYWEEGDDPRSGGWVWHHKGVQELLHPIPGAIGKDPNAEEEDLQFQATMDPEFPGGEVRFSLDYDNTPYRGIPW